MTDDGDKPEKPDPFAPLPLATLPPVRGRDTSGPTKAKAPKETLPGATPPTVTPPAPVATTRTRTPTVPPTAFAQPQPAPEDVSWTATSGERVGGQQVSGGHAAMADLAELGPAGGQPVSAEPQAWSDSVHQAWTEPPAAPVAEPPILPVTYSEDELRDAVGVTPRVETAPDKKNKKKKAPEPRYEDDEGDVDGGGRRMSRKTMFVGALTILMGGGITALVLLGKANAERYYLTCESDQVVVEQGRSFPPWGSSALDGPEWKPLKIPPETVCVPQSTKNHAELAGWYFAMLKNFADKQLATHDITKLDEAEGVLKQALLVTRSMTDQAAKDSRRDIDRLFGDVAYGRASVRVKAAADSLAEATKQFEAAVLANPAHTEDADAWKRHTQRVVDELRAGPVGVKAEPLAPNVPSQRPTAPLGTAQPVEPEGSGSAPAPVAPDAGVSGGGVMI